jgi:hypothetical protein
MAPAATMVQSSPTTRLWPQNLRERLPLLGYSEAKYYAAFKIETAGRTVAYLNPSQKSIRLFLALDPYVEPGMQETPLTSRWAARFPSLFRIRGKQDLTRAAQLILAAKGFACGVGQQQNSKQTGVLCRRRNPRRFRLRRRSGDSSASQRV